MLFSRDLWMLIKFETLALHGSHSPAVLSTWYTITDSSVSRSICEICSRTRASSSAEYGPCTLLSRPA